MDGEIVPPLFSTPVVISDLPEAPALNGDLRKTIGEHHREQSRHAALQPGRLAVELGHGPLGRCGGDQAAGHSGATSPTAYDRSRGQRWRWTAPRLFRRDVDARTSGPTSTERPRQPIPLPPGGFSSGVYYVDDGGIAADPVAGRRARIHGPTRAAAPRCPRLSLAFAMPGGLSIGARRSRTAQVRSAGDVPLGCCAGAALSRRGRARLHRLQDLEPVSSWRISAAGHSAAAWARRLPCLGHHAGGGHTWSRGPNVKCFARPCFFLAHMYARHTLLLYIFASLQSECRRMLAWAWIPRMVSRRAARRLPLRATTTRAIKHHNITNTRYRTMMSLLINSVHTNVTLLMMATAAAGNLSRVVRTTADSRTRRASTSLCRSDVVAASGTGVPNRRRPSLTSSSPAPHRVFEWRAHIASVNCRLLFTAAIAPARCRIDAHDMLLTPGTRLGPYKMSR